MLRIIRAGMVAGFFLAAAAAQAADVKVTGIHNCCGQCKAAITKALTDGGATNVTLEGANLSFSAEDPVKAVKALYDAGYAGKVEGAQARPPSAGARGVKGKVITVEGTHNCCGACVKALNEATKAVGTCNAKARDTSFTVSSDNEIEAAAVVRALREAGFNCHIKK
jgi:hypothetical protein